MLSRVTFLRTRSQHQSLSLPVATMVIPDITPSTHVSPVKVCLLSNIVNLNLSPPGLYQKIDPKVREARRKKFFGSGRRRRSTGDEDFREVHLDSEARQQKERDGAAQINRQGFHSCKLQHQLHSSLHCSTLLSISVLSQLLLFIIPHIQSLPGSASSIFSLCKYCQQIFAQI